MAGYSLTWNSFGSMQNMLLDVLGNDDAGYISGTTSRIDYGTNPMRETYTQFFGFQLDYEALTGVVTDIDIYWPNVGSTGLIVDDLPDIPLADLFALSDGAASRDALDRLLAQADWTIYGSAIGDDFEGIYSEETINGSGGSDYYTATMAPGLARAINDSFDGGEDDDTVNLLDLTVGVKANLKSGVISFSEMVNGVSYDRSITLTSVEEIIATHHDDKLLGSNAGDDLSGGQGVDVIKGRGGSDTLSGDAGGDRLIGGGGWDTLYGGGGGDVLKGGGGQDTLEGQGGKDRLAGGGGADVLDGGGKADRLEGGKGNDMLTGGKGRDSFVFDAGSGWQGRDIITDYELGKDEIVFDAGNVAVEVSHRDGDTVIEFDNGVIRLEDVLWPEVGFLTF